MKEQLASRLGYLERVGLGYLTLDRQARTLSGGEAQRAGLTTALGAALTGTLFVLDEPTVGLHADRRARRSRASMRELAARGQHGARRRARAAIVRACDRVVELGPGAGPHGGRILFDGTPRDAREAHRPARPGGRGPTSRERAATRAQADGAGSTCAARARTTCATSTSTIPLGVVVRGHGAERLGQVDARRTTSSTAPSRARSATSSVDKPGPHDALEGLGALARAVLVDQSPLGRTARGNPATYIEGVGPRPRALRRRAGGGAARADARRTSRSTCPPGRCEECSGEGYETVEMQFLADVQLALPGVPGQALQARGARGQASRQERSPTCSR